MCHLPYLSILSIRSSWGGASSLQPVFYPAVCGSKPCGAGFLAWRLPGVCSIPLNERSADRIWKEEIVGNRKRSGRITIAAAMVVACAIGLSAQPEPGHAAFEVASIQIGRAHV